jgi:hypothetical protein
MHNGWTNSETWRVHLWIANEQERATYWRDMAATLRKTPDALADALRQAHESGVEEALRAPYRASVYSDLLTGAVGRVNWDELARSLIAALEQPA